MLTNKHKNEEALAYYYAQIPKVMSLIDCLKSVGITHFGYDKFVGNDKYMAIYPEQPVMREKHGFTLDFDYFVQPQLDLFQEKNDFSLWQCKFDSNQFVDELKNFDIGNGIVFLNQPAENVFETYHFAGSNDNSELLNFYVNNLDFIKSFAQHFSEKMGDLLDHTVPGRLIHLDKPAIIKLHEGRNITSPEVILTKKEQNCLDLLKKGYTNKQIAKYFDNSPRTIEEHVANIMKKYKVDSRKAFIDF